MSAKEKGIVEPHALSIALKQKMKDSKILYISAPVGWGKTTAIRHHFRAQPHYYGSLWDEGTLDAAERDGTGLVILDDCHALTGQPSLQKRLCVLLRSVQGEGRVVLLSRAPVPEWLLPFQLTGLLAVVEDSAFALDTGDTAKLAEELGLSLTQEDILWLHEASRGHPLTLRLICMELAEGRLLSSETLQRAAGRLFAHLDRKLFDYWDSKIRRLLLSASFFDSFSIELAQVLTGDSQVERTLGRLLQISGFIDRQGGEYTIRYAPFRAYLRHKAETTWSRQEVDALYANAGMYYQLRGDFPAALDCYAKSGNHRKVSELLVEHSKKHPGQGVYYQLRRYYRSLTEQEILDSPDLMSGMSILCSLTLDTEGSEKWYDALKAYAEGQKRRTPERRAAQGMVDYLDIVLPHRGSANLQEILSAVHGRLAGGGRMPEILVTSNLPSILRGGKDFSSWVPKDKILYRTMSKPVEAVLGRLGVGLPDVALAESRYEKGEDISDAILTLASRRMEIQRSGSPEIEFVLTALLAKCQCDRGNAEQAVQDIRAFRARMESEGQTQLLSGIDALLCRIDLLTGGEYAHKWFKERAPDENDFFIMERYGYLTKVRCYLQRGEDLTALSLLGRLLDYFDRYERTLDRIETKALLAVCRWRMEGPDWQEHLTSALEEGKKYGYVRVFAHMGAALLPVLRSWKPPEEWGEKERKYVSRVQKAVAAFAARYPDHLAPGGPTGLRSLTKREMEVLRLMCRGKRGEEIRELLGISENTLKTHSRKLFKKLGVNSRAEAVAAAQRLHLV